MQHVVLTVPRQMADEQRSGLDNRQPAMTRKTKKTTARSQTVDELDQLEMFQEGGFDDNDPGADPDDDQADDLENGADEATFAAMEEAVHEAEHALDADTNEEHDEGHEAHERGNRRTRRRDRTSRAEPHGGVNILLFAGWFILMGAVGLLLVGFVASEQMRIFLESLGTAGLTPTALLTISVVVIGTAILRRRQANIEVRVGEVEATLLDNDTGITASLDYLVEAQEQHLDRPPASGEELERVLFVLERQDEKVNNLTRAIKMYGKPLIEITKQMAEVTSRVEALRQSMGSIAETVDSSGLEAALTDMSKNLQEQLGSNLDRVLAEVSKQDDEALPSMMAELKDEMSRMTSSIQALQKLQPSPAAARPVAPAPSSLDPSAITTASSSIGSAPSSRDPDHSGLAQSIAGTKRSPGKSVLGSIAKLRKMRE